MCSPPHPMTQVTPDRSSAPRRRRSGAGRHAAHWAHGRLTRRSPLGGDADAARPELRGDGRAAARRRRERRPRRRAEPALDRARGRRARDVGRRRRRARGALPGRTGLDGGRSRRRSAAVPRRRARRLPRGHRRPRRDRPRHPRRAGGRQPRRDAHLRRVRRLGRRSARVRDRGGQLVRRPLAAAATASATTPSASGATSSAASPASSPGTPPAPWTPTSTDAAVEQCRATRCDGLATAQRAEVRAVSPWAGRPACRPGRRSRWPSRWWRRCRRTGRSGSRSCRSRSRSCRRRW